MLCLLYLVIWSCIWVVSPAFPVQDIFSHRDQSLKRMFSTTESSLTNTFYDPLENQGIRVGHGIVLIEGDIRQRFPPRQIPAQAAAVAGGFRAFSPPEVSHRQENFRFRISVPVLEMTWTDRIVPYVIDDGFNTTEVHQIQMSINQLMEDTGHCITFIPRTYQDDFVFITGNIRGCWSDVGRCGGNQTVSISSRDNCVTKGIIMHELMHALGFWHEHTRSDRDSYVSVVPANIMLGHESDFNKHHEGHLFNVTYDFYSIMHYKTNQFSRDPTNLKTIHILDPNIDEAEVGQRKYLSEKDKQRIKLLYNCPLSKCSFPVKLNDGNVLLKNTSVGSRVTYSCSSPTYVLVGASERTCMYDGRWSGSTPLCFSQPSVPSYCNFEDEKICGWNQDTTDEADWTRHRSRTSSQFTGPVVDHTEQSPEGSYMYLEGTDLLPGYKARLISPVFQEQSDLCILFWYNMYGSGMGNLTVYLKSDEQILEEILRKSGNQSRGWNMDLIANLNVSTPFQVIFEATRGPTDSTDMAIDDVMIGECNEIASYESAIIHENLTEKHVCNFDTDTCGWQQDTNDNFDWVQNSGRTMSIKTGPDCDHTNCKNGSYMYIETSTGRAGDIARLVSPTISTRGPVCLGFSYHMYGTNIGNLTAIITADHVRVPVWSARSNHGNSWLTEYVQLAMQFDFQVVVEASRGNGFMGDIAIDDVMVLPGRCPAVTTCTFESGFCDFANDLLSDDFDWTIGKYTKSLTTGPIFDHTTGKGMFAYIEASYPRKPGHVARLQTSWLYGSSTNHCVSFWYYMYGKDIATLKIKLRRHHISEATIWSITGEQGKQWKYVNITTSTVSQMFQVVFEAAVGATYNSDIAIDDVSLKDGSCV